MKNRKLSTALRSFKKASLEELKMKMGSDSCFLGCSSGVSEDCKGGGANGQSEGECVWTGNEYCAKFCYL